MITRASKKKKKIFSTGVTISLTHTHHITPSACWPVRGKGETSSSQSSDRKRRGSITAAMISVTRSGTCQHKGEVRKSSGVKNSGGELFMKKKKKGKKKKKRNNDES